MAFSFSRDRWRKYIAERVTDFSAKVYKDGDTVYAVDGDGKTIAEGEAGVDDASVIQSALDFLPSGGGKILIKAGSYFVEGLDLRGKDYITLKGEGYSSALYLKYGASATLLKFSDYSNYCKIINLRFSGNGQAQRIIYSYGKHFYLEIRGCYFTEQGGAIGINLGRGAYLYFHDNVILCNKAEKNTDAAAIYTDYAVITNNIFIQTAGSGDLLTSAQMKHVIIADNIFRNTTDAIIDGIFCEVNLGDESDVVIANNVLDKCNIVVRGKSGMAYSGKRFTIANNSLQNGGNLDLRILDATSSDIGKIEDITVTGNKLDTGSLLLQGMKNVKVINNFLKGGVSLTDPNENVVLIRNEGYITENSGTATFSGDGTTTQFKIEHGLVSTPSKVQVTAMSSDAAGDFYVTADATYIYVTYKTAPPSGTDNVKLSWSAEV